jgi:hypothetical protein
MGYVIQIDWKFRRFQHGRVMFHQRLDRRVLVVEGRNAEDAVGAVGLRVIQQIQRFGQIGRSRLNDHSQTRTMLQSNFGHALALSQGEAGELAGCSQYDDSIGARVP